MPEAAKPIDAVAMERKLRDYAEQLSQLQKQMAADPAADDSERQQFRAVAGKLALLREKLTKRTAESAARRAERRSALGTTRERVAALRARIEARLGDMGAGS